MSSRRQPTGLSGVLLVDKPAGPTSHDVVASLRRATGERRVGHAGTLDPAATGLLISLIGPATRLASYLTGQEKTYEARIVFGAATDTLDAEGSVVETAPVPASVFEESRAREVLEGFMGASLQTPPAYSAVKKAGQTAHRAARSGSPLALEVRRIDVSEADLVRIEADQSAWVVRFTVSKGTYIRTLANDIGRRAGTVAHLAALRRTRSGQATLEHAHPLEEIADRAREGAVTTLFADPVPLLGLPRADLPAEQVAQGRPAPLPSDAPDGSHLFAVATDERLLAIYRRDGDLLRAETVFATGVAR